MQSYFLAIAIAVTVALHSVRVAAVADDPMCVDLYHRGFVPFVGEVVGAPASISATPWNVSYHARYIAPDVVAITLKVINADEGMAYSAGGGTYDYFAIVGTFPEERVFGFINDQTGITSVYSDALNVIPVSWIWKSNVGGLVIVVTTGASLGTVPSQTITIPGELTIYLGA